jgi:hypothetical protein
MTAPDPFAEASKALAERGPSIHDGFAERADAVSQELGPLTAVAKFLKKSSASFLAAPLTSR